MSKENKPSGADDFVGHADALLIYIEAADPALDLFPAPPPALSRMEDESDADFITRVRERLDDEAQLARDTKLAEDLAEDFDRLLDSDTAAGYEGQGSD
jgi:hypothetical protein